MDECLQHVKNFNKNHTRLADSLEIYIRGFESYLNNTLRPTRSLKETFYSMHNLVTTNPTIIKFFEQYLEIESLFDKYQMGQDIEALI